MKSKINTELKMKGVQWGKCGDAGPAEGSAHSVTLSHPTGTTVNHIHTLNTISNSMPSQKHALRHTSVLEHKNAHTHKHRKCSNPVKLKYYTDILQGFKIFLCRLKSGLVLLMKGHLF